MAKIRCDRHDERIIFNTESGVVHHRNNPDICRSTSFSIGNKTLTRGELFSDR